MMESRGSKRSFMWFRVEEGQRGLESPPLRVAVSDVTDAPVVPEDFGTGGFRFTAGKPAVPGDPVEVSVRVGESSLEVCKGNVIWRQECAGAGWTTGVAVQMSDDQRDRLSSHLTKFLAEKRIQQIEED
ncbi:MAG: hypothetical protein O2807_01980 [bacterium]|nr:hypothetical protein [bacterium]